MKESVNLNEVTKNEKLQTRATVPDDFHWLEEMQEKVSKGFLYLGEIYSRNYDKYYSALGGKKYRPKHKEKHLDEGHYQGYRFAVQELTAKNDWVFDPTVGSGTAIIEAINNGRNGIGIELEWPDLCRKNVDFQGSNMQGIVIGGNALHLTDLLNQHKDKFRELSLIVNGTPYPVISGGKSSDAPQRKPGEIDNYMHEDSFGLLKWNKDYRHFITRMYKDSIKFLKSGGYLVTIIKDPTHNKKAFMLQKNIIEWIKEENECMEDYGYFIHKHVPETFFMRTYPKQFSEVTIPKYQVGYILKKK